MTATFSASELLTDRLTDEDAHAAACTFLARLAGSHTPVRWDAVYHLQGHAVVDGRELVVVAPRDRTHEPLVVTAEHWDEIRRASQDQRSGLLCTYSITSRRRLRELVRRCVLRTALPIGRVRDRCSA